MLIVTWDDELLRLLVLELSEVLLQLIFELRGALTDTLYQLVIQLHLGDIDWLRCDSLQFCCFLQQARGLVQAALVKPGPGLRPHEPQKELPCAHGH